MGLQEKLQQTTELLTLQLQCAERCKMWVVVLGLKPSLDGSAYCFLWGDDLQSGISGFGDTVYQAMLDFESAMHRVVSAKGVHEARA